MYIDENKYKVKVKLKWSDDLQVFFGIFYPISKCKSLYVCRFRCVLSTQSRRQSRTDLFKKMEYLFVNFLLQKNSLTTFRKKNDIFLAIHT